MLGGPFAVALERLVRLSGRRAGIALVYHRVAADDGYSRGVFTPYVHVNVFEDQVRHVLARYRVVPAKELQEVVRRRRRGERFPVAITFDDDLASHEDVALTVLQQARIPATVFLSGASLEQPYSFWWERLYRAVAVGADMGMISAAVLRQSDPAAVARMADLHVEI